MRIVTVRASSMPDAFDCAARWEAKQLRGLRTPMAGNAVLGRALHRSTAMYDASVINGTGLTIQETAAAAIDAFADPGEDVAYDEDDDVAALERTAVALHHRYCTEVAPAQRYAAVEVRCDSLVIEDLGLELTGTADRVRKVGDGFGIADIKSGKTAVRADGTVESKGHRYQIGVYELLAEHASGLPITAPAQVIGLQTGKTERGQRVGVSEPVSGARDVLVGEEDSPGVLQMLSKMIHSGSFPGNPRSMMCHERYCPLYNACKYRK